MYSDIISQIRTEKKNARNSLSIELRKELSFKICESIASSEIFREAKTVMLYRFVKGEVQLSTLEQIALSIHKRVVYPLCINPFEMIAMEPVDHTSWKKGAFGIDEPDPEHSLSVNPADIDLVICPCTVFDGSCNRIGMGGGYYDRFLPECKNATVVAVAFEVQKTSEIIRNSWDVPMEYVFTEDHIYRRLAEK